MKKKLFKSLMLLVVAVSIGAFVSCKDTNEDLYNQLRTQTVNENASLIERYDDLINTLNSEIDALKAAYDAIETSNCTCDKDAFNNLKDLVDQLNNQLTGGQGSSGQGGTTGGVIGRLDDIDGSGSSIETVIQNLETLINNITGEGGDLETITNILTQHGNSITLLQTNYTTAQQQLADAISDLTDLKNKVDNIDPCKCDFDAIQQKITDIETRLANVETKAQDALTLATTADGKADGAALTAAEAKSAAEAATTAANAAANLAQQAFDLAQSASDDAATAASTANSALTLAIQLSDIATQLQTQANANTEAIGNLQNTITTINQTLSDYKELIDTNTANIASNLGKIQENANNIATNAAAILQNKTDISNMQTTLTQVSNDVKTALENASTALNKATINSAAIDNLKPRVEQNETDIANLKSSVETLQTNINTLTTTFNQKVSELESDISTNATNISTLTTRLDNLSSDVTNLKTKVDNIESNVTTLQSDMQELTNTVTTLDTKLTQAIADCQANYTNALEYAKAQAEAVDQALRQHIKDTLSYYYTAEEIKTLLADQDVKINGNTARIDQLVIDLSTLTSTVDGHTTSINTINGQIEYILQHLCECEPVDLSEIQQKLTDAEGRITTNENDIAAIKQDIADRINANITQLTEDLNTLTGKHNDLEDKVNNLNYITPEDVNDLLDVIRAKAKADSTTLANRLDGHDDAIEGLNTTLNAAVQDIVDLKTLTQILRDSIYNHEVRINTAESAIGDLQTAVENINTELTSMKGDIKDLQDRMAVVEDSLATALKDIKELKSDVAAVQEYLAKQVTGIIVQGATNPWFGSFSTPFGVQSNMVIALYGLPMGNIEFPNGDGTNYLYPEEALSEKDMEMLDYSATIRSNKPLMLENGHTGKGYAGKVYMTINPNTVDVTGLEPKIVNTLGEESAIKLEGVTPSTERLQFGWTRADGSGNGFYEAEAIIKPSDVGEVSYPSFNLAAVKDAAKNVKEALTNLLKTQSTSGNGENLENLANDVNKIVQGLKFDRSGLMVSYEDPTVKDANGDPQKKQVISEYNLAATAFQPLNLQHIKDIPHVVTIPGYERIEGLINRVANTAKSKVTVFFDGLHNNGLVKQLDGMVIKNIEVPVIDQKLVNRFVVHMDTVIFINGLSYTLDLGKEPIHIKFTGDATIPIDIEGDAEINLNNVQVDAPTIVVTTDITNKTGGAELLVPVMDGETQVGTAVVNLDDVDVKADAEVQGGTITLNGLVVGHLSYHDTKPVTLTVDAVTQIDLVKHINLGYYGYVQEPDPDRPGKYRYARDEEGHLIPLTDADGNPIPGETRGMIIRFDYDMRDAAEELWGMAADALDSVNNGVLKQVQDLLDSANDLLDQINSYESKINGTITDIANKLKSYLDKINGGITKIINTTRYRVCPFAVANTSNGMKRLGAKGYPAKLGSDVTLYLTSQTMELFVPFARKHVGVTNVFKDGKSAQGGDGDCKAKLDAANSAADMNKMLDGTVREVKMGSLSVGYTYEVAYSALDFSGNISTRKFYFTVVQ